MWRYLIGVAVALAAASIVGAGPAHAEEIHKADGPVTLYISIEGTTVFEMATTLALDHGTNGDLRAYYLIVPPDGNVKNAKKVWSDHVFHGPLRPGVARDSYGPTGGFLKGTLLCAAWFDPTGIAIHPGIPCERIPV